MSERRIRLEPDRFASAIEPLRASVAGLVEQVVELRSSHRDLPHPGSPAEREREHDSRLAGSWGEVPVTAAHQGAGLMMAAAEDHITALVELLAHHHPVFAHQPLARSALEALGRVAYLAQVPLPIEQRVARWMNERIYSATEADQLFESDRSGRAVVASILDGAKEHDLVKLSGRRRPPELVERRPSATDLVRVLLLDGDDPEGFGRASFKFFSATTHSTLYAVLQRIEPPTETELATLRPSKSHARRFVITSEDLNTTLVALTFGYTAAVQSQLQLMGWPAADLQRAITNALQLTRRFVREV